MRQETSDLHSQQFFIFCLFSLLSLSLCFISLPLQGGGATETGADVRTFMAFGAQVKEQRRHPAGVALPQMARRHQQRCVLRHVFWFNDRNLDLSHLIDHSRLFVCVCAGGPGRSELDELQEEVARRARQQEQQKRREAEREAAMGFNPKPSKFMDLDQLQQQGMETDRGMKRERQVGGGEGGRERRDGRLEVI